jgi:Uma2 family endonuclease
VRGVTKYVMAVPYAPLFTVKEYLALEAVAEIKHEYCGGRIIAMAGADPAHNIIVSNLQLAIGNALADGPCLVLGSDQRVICEAIGEYFYPDLTVTCVEPRFAEPRPQSLANPQVIVEVLSETTARYDRGDKWSAYRLIPTLTDYVMVSSLTRELEHFQRAPDGSWMSRMIATGSVPLTGGIVLEVDAIDRRVR